MKAVVIYEKFEFAERVGGILRRVAARAEINIEWTVLTWPVDALNEKKFAEKALAQARDANLIVLPARLARSIPDRLLGWLEGWAELRHNAEMALGIFDDSAVGRVEAIAHPALSRFASKYGLAVIGNGSLLDPDRQSALPIELYHYGNSDQPGTYRGFGIND